MFPFAHDNYNTGLAYKNTYTKKTSIQLSTWAITIYKKKLINLTLKLMFFLQEIIVHFHEVLLTHLSNKQGKGKRQTMIIDRHVLDMVFQQFALLFLTRNLLKITECV